MCRSGVWMIVAMGWLAAACEAQEGEPAAGALVMCTPLAAATADVALASLVGAGVDEAGTVYVVDKLGSELRAFISQQGELYRERVSGTGEVSVEGEDRTTVTLAERLPELRVQVAIAADGAKRMGVLEGPLAAKTFVLGEQGEELSMLTAEAVTELPIHDYPAELEVEYAAELEDGRLLVVLGPRDVQSYEDYRLFFGSREHLEERTIISLGRLRDGGTTTIDFELDGASAQAFFPIELVEETFAAGPPELRIGQESIGIELLEEAPPPGATYYCAE